MSVRRAMWCLAATAIAVAGAVWLVGAGALTASAAHAQVVCNPRVAVIATGQGAPDDLAWDGHKLLVSDVNAGTISVVAHGTTTTLVGNIDVPEGIIARPHNTLEVAEQGPNRIIDINLTRHTRTTVVNLPSVAGKTGVDGINAAPGGATFVPDSENGDLYLLRGRHLKLIATGMVRPVSAVKWSNGVAVADEYAADVWLVRPGGRTNLAPIALTDDLAILSGHLLATRLVLGELWEIAPHQRLLSNVFKNPQGVVTDGRDAVIVSDQTTNKIYRVSNLAPCL